VSLQFLPMLQPRPTTLWLITQPSPMAVPAPTASSRPSCALRLQLVTASRYLHDTAEGRRCKEALDVMNHAGACRVLSVHIQYNR
jgi:hypothetical protein